MLFSISQSLRDKLGDIHKRDSALSKKIQKQLKLFQLNEKHPSLRTHKLSGELSDSWSISVGLSVRMLYVVEDGRAIFYEIGTHDQVYR